ncbi:acyl-CoA thioesterase [Alteribacillus sp. HJP-4]|uniref:acyl-CoA thioesterase n=1 Tax=Alteribacillus sp. HJP-4 TaxID=2775394 RepID=UPI0035CD170A
MEKRTVQYSKSIQTRLVLPPDTNHLDTIFGGKILAYIDEIAAVAAMKHSNSTVVTASIDSVDFVSSAKAGEALTLEASLTYTGTSSMEVYVRVTAHDMIHNIEKLTTESFLTMVAVDEDGNPVAVPGLRPETEEEIRLFETAPARRESRKNRSRTR